MEFIFSSKKLYVIRENEKCRPGRNKIASFELGSAKTRFLHLATDSCSNMKNRTSPWLSVAAFGSVW